MYGWLTPNRKFVECDAYEHLEVLEKIPEIVAAIGAKLDEVWVDVNSARDYCEDAGCEWHTYEWARDDARADARAALLDAGFIRIGQDGIRIHFEGRPQTLADRRQECKDFAEHHGCVSQFEPQTQ